MEVRIQSRPLLGKHEVYGAVKLGIEALKLVDQLRFDGSPYYPKPLIGETE